MPSTFLRSCEHPLMCTLKRRECRLNPTFTMQMLAPQSFADDFRSKLRIFPLLFELHSLMRFCRRRLPLRRGHHSTGSVGKASALHDVVVATGTLLTTISVRISANGYIVDQLQKLFLVCIAFKLVQRMNNLIKTAMYVEI